MKFWKKKDREARDQLNKLFSQLSSKSPLGFAFAGDKLQENIYVDFIFLIIEEPLLDRFEALCSQAFQIAREFNVDLTANAGGLLQIAVGAATDSADVTEKRIKLSSRFADCLGDSARIVHGRAQSRVGVVGTEFRKTGGFYPNAITQILQTLVASPRGTPVDLGRLWARYPVKNMCPLSGIPNVCIWTPPRLQASAGWVERSETHQDRRPRWVSLRSTQPTS